MSPSRRRLLLRRREGRGQGSDLVVAAHARGSDRVAAAPAPLLAAGRARARPDLTDLVAALIHAAATFRAPAARGPGAGRARATALVGEVPGRPEAGRARATARAAAARAPGSAQAVPFRLRLLGTASTRSIR